MKPKMLGPFFLCPDTAQQCEADYQNVNSCKRTLHRILVDPSIVVTNRVCNVARTYRTIRKVCVWHGSA